MKEEGNACCLVGWIVLLHRRCRVDDKCPAAVSVVTMVAVVAIAWLLSLPLT